MNRRTLSLLALPVFASLASAQCWDHELAVGTTDTRLPGGLAVGPGVIAFGQPRFDPYLDPTIEDFVRVFELAGGSYQEVAAFNSSLPGNTAASFGVELDLDDEWLAVGDPSAHGASGAGGAVHLYRRTLAGWSLQQVLQPVPLAGQFLTDFGRALDLEGTTLVVGAPFSTSAAGQLEDGLVLVYDWTPTGWVEVQRIAHPAPTFFAGFGRAVSIDGGRLLVGSPGDPTPASGLAVGAAHLYDRACGTFVHAAELRAAAPPETSGFGGSVALEGGVAAVGASGAEVAGEFAGGHAHVFEEQPGGWSEVAVLEETPWRAYHRFGDDVELEDGALYVSAAGAMTARRYERGPAGWASAHRYTTRAGVTWAIPMPLRVRASGATVVLTAPWGATVFALDVPASLENGCPGVPLASSAPGYPATPVFLDVRGELRLSRPALDFAVFAATGIGNGLLFYGFGPANLPLGKGRLCVGLPIARAALGGPFNGSFYPVALDLWSAPVSSGPTAILPGVSVHFQYWFRTTGGGTHLSNSLVATFCP